MSDIKCVVCGEPWDAYGVTHGDMLKWEAALFKAGAGCPSCEGQSNGWTPERFSDIENGDEDPMLRILAREAHERGKVPKWERPADKLLWTCDGCGIRVEKSADDGSLAYSAPFKSRASYEYWHRNADAPEEPEHTFEDGTAVCEKCYRTCKECGEPVPPNDGYPHPANDYHDDDVVCGEDCLCKAESEHANEVWRTCYDALERIDYIRRHRSQFEFRSFADMLGCVRGQYFAGWASELIAH